MAVGQQISEHSYQLPRQLVQKENWGSQLAKSSSSMLRSMNLGSC